MPELIRCVLDLVASDLDLTPCSCPSCPPPLQDVLISAAMQTVIAISNGTGFAIQYAGSTKSSGNTEMAPFLIHESFGSVCAPGSTSCLIGQNGVVYSTTPVSWPVSNVLPGSSAPSTNLLSGQCTLVPAGVGLALSLTSSTWVQSVVLTVAAGTPVVNGALYFYYQSAVRLDRGLA